jgi:hypothetical protein
VFFQKCLDNIKFLVRVHKCNWSGLPWTSSDAKNKGLSNAENIDENKPISDALKSWPKSSNSAVTGGNQSQAQRRHLT